MVLLDNLCDKLHQAVILLHGLLTIVLYFFYIHVLRMYYEEVDRQNFQIERTKIHY
jgi:hypothetical protein